MVKMAVNKYCGDCIKMGEFLPLKLVMMNINCGVWMCPKKDCTFPMTSGSLRDYMEENLSSDKILLLTGKNNITNQAISKSSRPSSLCQEKLKPLHHTDTVEAVGSTYSSNRQPNSDEDSLKTASLRNDETNSATTETLSLPFLGTDCSSLSKKIYKSIPLWENEELLCWLDTILSLLVLNETIAQYENEEGTLARFLREYKHALSCFDVTQKYEGNIKTDLTNLRTSMLKFLHPKMMSDFTEEDSPLLSIQLLIKTDKTLYEDLEWEYSSNFSCTECQFQRKDGFRKIILHLPEANKDLDLAKNLYYTRNCYRCSAPSQKLQFEIERYPNALFIYFENGVGNRKFWKHFNFTTSSGETYIVTQIVQYITKRKHFVLWSYSYKEKLWIEADDLKEPVVQCKYGRPKCRPYEVHLMVLEKVSILENAPSKVKSTDGIDTSGTNQTNSEADLHSPTLSGVSSTLPVTSGVSSRRTSLCSTDGFSPAGTPSGSVHSLNNMNIDSKMTHSGEGEQSSKHKFLHVPRYQPYLPRSKQRELEQSTVLYADKDTSYAFQGDTRINDSDMLAEASHTHEFQNELAVEMDNFYSELLNQQDSDEVTLSSTGSNLVSNIVQSANTNREPKIDFDISTTTGGMVTISDDELDEILNG